MLLKFWPVQELWKDSAMETQESGEASMLGVKMVGDIGLVRVGGP